jgi:hypothetical protein
MRSIAFENQDSLWANILVHEVKDVNIIDGCGKLFGEADPVTERMSCSREKVAPKALRFMTSFGEVEDKVK